MAKRDLTKRTRTTLEDLAAQATTTAPEILPGQLTFDIDGEIKEADTTPAPAATDPAPVRQRKRKQKTARLDLRVTDETKAFIDDLAEIAGVSTTTYITMLIHDDAKKHKKEISELRGNM